MNLLIVDDQVNVINGLLNAINYSDLGYENVFSATSADEALEICKTNDIHVMMTDIEMPGINGLELNSIIMEEYPAILRIILTSHAVFSYAQESVKLGCFDYIVQPAPYETISKSLGKAAEAVNLNYNNRRMHEYGNLFKSHENEFLSTAIQKLYLNDDRDVEDSIAILNQSGYNFTKESYVTLMWADFFAYTHQTPGYPPQRLLMKTLSDAMAEIHEFDSYHYFTTMSPFRAFSIFLISDQKEPVEISTDAIERLYTSLSEQIPTSDLALYVSSPDRYANITEQIRKANDCILNNIAHVSGIFSTSAWNVARSMEYNLPNNLKHWSSLLESGQLSTLKQDIFFCLEYVIPNNPNRYENLLTLHQQLIQLFFRYFYENNIDTAKFITGEYSYRKIIDLCSSVDDVKKVVNYLIDSMGHELDHKSSDSSYTEKAKQYIAENYNKEITVKAVADYVHLNPEYFTRLFKKETGVNIKDYITDCRINMAKDLLENSTLTISMIASELGYTNLSHFAYLFKRKEGITPKEYKDQLHHS